MRRNAGIGAATVIAVMMRKSAGRDKRGWPQGRLRWGHALYRSVLIP
jgi:hypothetical protein